MSEGNVLETAPEVARAAAELGQEHQALEAIAHRTRSASQIEALVGALEELSHALSGHFAREEKPGGLYDALGVCVPGKREPLARLVDDHYRMAATARGLAERGRLLMGQLQGLREEAAALVALLEDHERREHALVREATGR